MSLAITEDHQALFDTVSEFLTKRDVLADARALLDGAEESLPPFWDDIRGLGWLGLHIPEDLGGSGYGISELVVVVEGFGRDLAPGPFVPTVIASATLASALDTDVARRLLPELANGSTLGAVALGGSVTLGAITSGDVTSGGAAASGSAGVVLGARLADILLVGVGDDVAVVDARADGVTVEVPSNIDPTRTSARVTLDSVPAEVLPGARRAMVDLARTILAAEATGIARQCTLDAAAYAKDRHQFGRPIAMFQAVKHHCANMLVEAELATAAVWEAARAASDGGDRFTHAAAIAATLAVPAADLDANLNIQVHGGVGFTWEHDAHLYLRRATALGAIAEPEVAAREVTELARRGVRGERSIDLPPEAETIRDDVRSFIAELDGLDADTRLDRLIASGYAQPHWPAPWGRDAGAVEQLVIEQEFAQASVKRPSLGITSWVILTLIQHATEEQVQRWVPDAMRQDVIWCQLFSEPDAGSDAAGITTRATRVDGGWLINGQKVWTSGAHVSGFGLATVRTDPDVPKHEGITTVVIDMKGDGVEVRPLTMPNGMREFNEVFFDDVFVPDDDVVGPVNAGWTVARATLGNESVSIGGGEGGMSLPAEALIAPFDAHPDRLAGGAGRLGRYLARSEAIGVLNLRSAQRAVAGGGPGPEGNVTKLVLSELGHDAAAILGELGGPETAFTDDANLMTATLILLHRAMSIAGGTSEIKRNQIGERILGLPRDPLIK